MTASVPIETVSANAADDRHMSVKSAAGSTRSATRLSKDQFDMEVKRLSKKKQQAIEEEKRRR